MRVLILDTCYPLFLQEHYAGAPSLAAEPYETQWRALMDRHFATADAYSHYLGKLGHEAHEVVANCLPLQQAWAAERGLRRRWYGRSITSDEILLAQVESFAPDVVYVQDLRAFAPHLLRRLHASGTLLAGQTASELPRLETLRQFDVILTSFPHYVDELSRRGVPTEYLRIGFDPRVLPALGNVTSQYGAVFVGSLSAGRQHVRGNELLERAARRAEIDFWGPGADTWPRDSPIRRRHHGTAWGLDMYRVLAAAKLAVNRHIEVAAKCANNMRLYEATGIGTLLLTDTKQNLRELFEPGREVLTYADETELAEQIGRVLQDEDERVAIARAGHERTLREHTYADRMRDLVEILSAQGA